MGNAVSYDNQGARLQIGYWGIELGKGLIESQKVPVCFINGSVGGSRIDVHQKNLLNPTDSTTIYGRLLWRIRAAGLTHGIRGVLWHQGENDQGAAGPDGRYGWEGYRQYFIDMSGAWKQDYPNILHYYIFQIWPRSCAMTENGSDNVLREVQRTLPGQFSNMSIMSTLGIKPPGGCHFPPEGYAEIAHLIQPVVEKESYGRLFDKPVTPPDLQRAWYSVDRKDEITLEFDQPVVWKDSLETQFYLDGKSGEVASGSVSGNILRLKLKAPSAARRISYLDSKSWSQSHLLWGKNGIAALTFWGVQVAASKTADIGWIDFKPTIESLKQYETPEWFKDAKLGIYMHWGPQSIPGVATTWYARWMYEQGSEGYKYHVATYGHPSKFGYKDICRLFTAPKFDQEQADRLVRLYKKTGARYVVPVAVHHDNFDMWDSKYQPRFNSVATSGKDIVGMWKKAAAKEGLHLGVASHVARTYRWLQPSQGTDKSGPLAGVPYDGQDDEYSDLYGVKWDDTSFWYEQRSDVGPPEFEQQFENRMKDLLDKYQPDLLLNVPLTPDGELEPETVSVLTEVGNCLDIIGEAVFFTRAWVVADDGPGDIRFTRNKENTVLYVTNLAWPGNELRIKTLRSSKVDLNTISEVSMLGTGIKLAYSQNADEMIISLPRKAPFDSPAYAFKFTFNGQIPAL